MDTTSRLLRHATTALIEARGLAAREARLEAQILLCHALQRPRSWLVAHDNDALDPGLVAVFQSLLERRLSGEPIAYITAEREFYGLPFHVTPAVLIPRPETELLVELALARLPENRASRVLDLGTGSGAIALTLAKLRPLAAVTAVDLSADALEVARGNARRLAVANVEFVRSAWFAALPPHSRFDAIVSNPPYIVAGDPHLAHGDLRFEPPAALASGPDGLDDIRVIVSSAAAHLVPGGWLLFEHGYDQAAACRILLEQAGFREVASVGDLAGIERATLGRQR